MRTYGISEQNSTEQNRIRGPQELIRDTTEKNLKEIRCRVVNWAKWLRIDPVND